MKTHHQITVQSIRFQQETVPRITFTGRWLAENGFTGGRRIHVFIQPGRMTINLLLPKDHENV